MNSSKFYVLKRIKSFCYAFNGLKILFKEEPNAKIHLVIAMLAMFLAILLNVNTNEWLFIVLSIGLVISMELLNSAVESLADFVSIEKNELIKKVKDLAAGGVFLSSIIAFIVGVVVFLPKIWRIIRFFLKLNF